MRSPFLLLLFVAIPAAGLYSQAPQADRPLSLNAKQRIFVEGRTLVKELRFSGLDEKFESSDNVVQDPIYENDIRYAFRQGRSPVQANEKLDLEKVGNAIAVIKEYLFQRGYFSAKVIAFGKKLAPNEMAVILSVERGPRSTVSGVRFHGMNVFAEDELRSALQTCLGSGWGEYKLNHIEYCAQKDVRWYMWERGYLQTRISPPLRKFGKETVEIHFQVNEGIRYRFGEISLKGNKLLTDREILEILELTKGEVVQAKKLKNFPDSKLVDIYKDKGYMEMSGEIEPKYLLPLVGGMDGTVNFDILIDEGRQFTFGSVKFVGVGEEVANEIRGDFPLRRGDVYSQKEVYGYIKKLNDSGRFRRIDPDIDVDIRLPVDEPQEPSLDGKLTLRSPRSERRNDIDITVKIASNQD